MNNLKNVSEEKQLEFEMFANFGYTVFLAQKFEKALASFLQGEFAVKNKGEVPYEQYIEEVTRLYKGNLGGLLRKLRNCKSISVEKEDLLQRALNRRNYLVHNYFYHNESKATVTDGKFSIIQELLADQAMFSEIVIWIDDMCKEGLRKIEVSAEKFTQLAESNRLTELSKFRKGEPIDLISK